MKTTITGLFIAIAMMVNCVPTQAQNAPLGELIGKIAEFDCLPNGMLVKVRTDPTDPFAPFHEPSQAEMCELVYTWYEYDWIIKIAELDQKESILILYSEGVLSLNSRLVFDTLSRASRLLLAKNQ